VHVSAAGGSGIGARPGDWVHVVAPLELKLPFWRYFELFRRRPYAFLLDSAKEAGGLGRFSFAGADPVAVFRAKRTQGGPPRSARIRISRSQRLAGDGRPRVSEFVSDPLAELRLLLAELAPPVPTAGPTPFTAGAVGYFGYEAGHFVEELPDRGRDDLGLPDIQFGLFDLVLGHDHASTESYVSVIARSRRAAEARLAACRRAALELESDAHPAAPAATARAGAPDFAAHFDRDSYAAAVEACRRHIIRGDAFEICLTHRLQTPFAGDTWRLYCELRAISPAPFAAYLELPGVRVLSSSPERFLRLKADGLVESRPIKGTRPRGATPHEDAALHDELKASVKDHAENMMIVDLVRNDLGRVCDIGSVEVSELMAIERYATLFQMVSTVRGRLQAGRDALDVVRVAFPGGSMTGAPKIEAMKIIDGLEPVKRGIYSGSIGYIDVSGAADLNIVIRTLIVKDGQCYLNVGGAIVADSDPFEEYDETMDKAHALKLALAATAAR
jgi:para-aminobenzoate synthetase component 1